MVCPQGMWGQIWRRCRVISQQQSTADMISSPIKGQLLPLCVRLPRKKCLWPLLLPEDFQLRGSLKISLMLGRIVSGTGVLFVPLGKGETFKQREYSSQLSIPLCFTGKVGGSRRMDLSPCSANTSVFTSPSSIAAEHTCFPSCFQAQPILCHQLREVEGVGVWEGQVLHYQAGNWDILCLLQQPQKGHSL